MRRDDADLRLQVEAALATIMPSNLSVAVRDGNVTVRGVVVNDDDVQRVKDAVATVPDVRNSHVDVSIGAINRIRATNRTEPGEIDLTDRGLGGQERVGDTAIDLNEEIGTSDFQTAADEAVPYFPPTDPVVRPASRVREEGMDVVGGFAATSTSGPTDRQDDPDRVEGTDDDLAQDVTRALQLDAVTSDLDIRVEVVNGVVYLRGEVDTLDEAEQAEAIASQVSGIDTVEEQLTVRSLRR